MFPIPTIIAASVHCFLYNFKKYQINQIEKQNYALVSRATGEISAALQNYNDKTKVPIYLKEQYGADLTQLIFNKIVLGDDDNVEAIVHQAQFPDVKFPITDAFKYITYTAVVIDLYRLANYFEFNPLGNMLKILYDISPNTVLSIGGDYVIDSLAKSGANFFKLDIPNLAYTIRKLGIEGIKSLSEISVDFSKLGPAYLSNIILALGIESIKVLSEIGANFSKLDGEDIRLIITKLGIEIGIKSIKALAKAGVDFSKLQSPEMKLLIEKELAIDTENLLSGFEEKSSVHNEHNQIKTKEVSLDQSFRCDDKDFNYTDVCIYDDNVISEQYLSCTYVGNISEYAYCICN